MAKEIGWFVFLLAVWIGVGAASAAGPNARPEDFFFTLVLFILVGISLGTLFIILLMVADFLSTGLPFPWSAIAFVGAAIIIVAFFAVVPSAASGHPLPQTVGDWFRQVLPFFAVGVITTLRNVSRPINPLFIEHGSSVKPSDL